MKGTIAGRLLRGLHAIGVALALVIGAGQLLGTEVALEDPCQPCPYPSQEECETCCIDEIGGSGGTCFPSGACICVF